MEARLDILYKLEKATLNQRLTQMRAEGTRFVTDCEVGVDVSVEVLREQYDAVVLAVPAPAAARLLGAAEALRKALGRSLSSGELATNALLADSIRSAIGDDAFTAAWNAGRASTLDEAVATALAMTPEDIRDR